MLRVATFLAALVMLLSGTASVRAAGYSPAFASIDLTQSHALFVQTNVTRAALGLPALTDDQQLDRLAAQLAQQMVRQGYFGHTDPSGVTFEQRVRAAGIRYHFAAENIATADDAAQAADALVHSPDHYANIVDPHVRKLGTAAVPGGDGEMYFVQEFAD